MTQSFVQWFAFVAGVLFKTPTWTGKQEVGTYISSPGSLENFKYIYGK